MRPFSNYFARYITLLLMTGAMAFSTGCASWSNPVANGIPAYLVPSELLAPPKEAMETIPLSYLRRQTAPHHILGPGDILGVYVEGAIGNDRELPPVSFPDSDSLPPSLGFPIPIRDDGAIPLPLIEPVHVAGMTIEQAERAVKFAYTQEQQILKEGKQRIIVTIIRPRTIRVLVVRKDSVQQSGYTQVPQFLNSQLSVPTSQAFNDGVVLQLPENEADLFSALARSGGLPTDSATDDILIYRGNPLGQGTGMHDPMQSAPQRIPFRIPVGIRPPLTEEDIILKEGDIVVVDRRKPEFYYTAGILPNREVPLPYDYNLTVTEAIARVGGPLLNGGIGANLAGATVGAGIGNPSPSLLSLIRTLPDGRHVNIRVDVNEAFRDPREDLLLMPGDMLVLQETPRESFARYLTNVFSFGVIGEVFTRGDAFGVGSITVP